jgi:AcrR family transcriptional regulator
MAGEHVQFRSGKRRQTEGRIIAAAADLFLEHGYRSTTVRAIAKAAEVSVGRVMSVGDKDELLVRCFDRWIGQLQDGTLTPPPPPRQADLSRTASAVQHRLLEIFLPFLEFFAAHEDLSRDCAAAMIRVRGDPEVFSALAADLQARLSQSLTAIGISDDLARASAAGLYDAYLGILFRWAATTMTLTEATDSLLDVIAFHTRIRIPL